MDNNLNINSNEDDTNEFSVSTIYLTITNIVNNNNIDINSNNSNTTNNIRYEIGITMNDNNQSDYNIISNDSVINNDSNNVINNNSVINNNVINNNSVLNNDSVSNLISNLFQNILNDSIRYNLFNNSMENNLLNDSIDNNLFSSVTNFNLLNINLYNNDNFSVVNLINNNVITALPFSETFVREYVLGNYDKCIELIENVNFNNENNENNKEIYLLYQYLFIKLTINKKLVYHKKIFKLLFQKYNIEKYLYHAILKYNLIKYIFERDELFQNVIYSRKNWCQEFKYNNNWNNLINLIILLGNNKQLVWFLDWQKFNRKLDWFKYETNRTDYYKVCLLSHKYDCVETLRKYGFRFNIYKTYYFLSSCGLVKYNLKLYKNSYIFSYSSLFKKISYQEFLLKYRELFDDINYKCENLTGKYLLNDIDENNNNIFNYGDKESCIQWNTTMLYELPYPPKIILMACKNICIRSEHYDCCNLQIICNECEYLNQKYHMEVCIQYYMINKKLNNEKYNELKIKLLLKKMYSRLYLNYLIKKNENDCYICFDKFSNNDKVIDLSCHHCYHENCLKQWKKESNVCPYCRKFMSSYNTIKL